MTNNTFAYPPLNDFVGNFKARRRLARCIKTALNREDHSLEEFSFALLGPASVGKTMLARKISECVNLPFVVIEPLAVDTTQDILLKIASVLNEIYGETKMDINEECPNKIVLCPMIVFIDEVHNLSKNCVQGLLKATEKKDGIMDTGKWVVDCRHVCWIIATTEAGRLFSPFQTRFANIQLNLYTEEEIAQIVNLEEGIDWGIEVSRLVAKYAGRVPREAIAFAKEMIAEGNQNNWEEVAKLIAIDREIDLEWCMTKQRINVLKSLSSGPVSKNRMCNVANCQIEELERMVMPTLMNSTEENPALVTTTTRGFCLTANGVSLLDKHNVSHKPVEELLE